VSAGQIKLSVVVAGSRAEGLCPRLLESLSEMLRSGRAEVVVATARSGQCDGTRTVHCDPGTTVPRLRSLGFEEVRGDIVALTEDFCAPAPGWAEALVAAHEKSPAVAVGGPMGRRDGRASAWALTLCEYGRFFGPRTAGPVSDLPGTNVSYKVAKLREVLGDVPSEFQEVLVHGDLRERGETFYWEPAARMYDESDRPFRSALRAQYHHGRLYGGQRIHGRGLAVRVLRAALSPLVPVVLLFRIARAVVPSGNTMPMLRSMPYLLCLLIAWGIGEGVGSIAGVDQSEEQWT
jgi:hypothetical protein